MILRNKPIYKIFVFLLIWGMWIVSLNANTCNCCLSNCCIPQKPKPIMKVTPEPLVFKSLLPNDCIKWLIVPIDNGLNVPIQIYDPSITEHDHDCDGIVDSQDPDVDVNGIVVNTDRVSIQKNEKILIDVLANDMDIEGHIDPSTLKITEEPEHGSVRIVDGKAYYVPDSTFTGYDTFLYVVKDNDGFLSKPTLVAIEVIENDNLLTMNEEEKINHVPVAYGASYETNEDTPVTIKLTATDIDHDPLSYSIVGKPKYGKLLGKAPNVMYEPKKDFSGADTFTFKVYDGKDYSSLASVHIQVMPVNDDPVANDDTVFTDEGVLVILNPLLNDIDTDGNSSNLHIVSITQPHYGIALLEGENVFYTSKSDSATQDTLMYTIEDENGGRNTATITINIASQNDAPVANDQTIVTDEDHAVSFSLSGVDPDGDILNYTLMYTQLIPEHGTLSGNAPDLIYTPDANFTGEDYIVFKVDDGRLESDAAIVNIVVHPLNDPPIADAGVDTSGIRGDTFILDGSGSYDIDGYITSYVWKEDNITISNQKTFDYRIMNEGIHIIILTVTDDQNTTDSDKKTITINPCCDGCNYPDPIATDPYK